MLNSLVNHHKEFGTRRTIQMIVSVLQDAIYDRFNGMDTSLGVLVEDLEYEGDAKLHATQYSPTRERYLNNLLDHLQLPDDTVLVDFGSGKARVVFIAARRSIKRAVGIEISRELHDIASDNLEKFKRKFTSQAADIELLNLDAREYPFRGDETLFYFYRPFDSHIMQQVVDRILESLQQTPRNAWLVISHNVYVDLLKQYSQFAKKDNFLYGSAQFEIYRYTAST